VLVLVMPLGKRWKRAAPKADRFAILKGCTRVDGTRQAIPPIGGLGGIICEMIRAQGDVSRDEWRDPRRGMDTPD
jgi:hypothetical protein